MLRVTCLHNREHPARLDRLQRDHLDVWLGFPKRTRCAGCAGLTVTGVGYLGEAPGNIPRKA